MRRSSNTREQSLSIEGRLRLFLKVCAAIAYAHRSLVVHRDIKPSNILVTSDGEPKLLDFGLAKAFESDISQTSTVLRAFTPAYASPEQIQGHGITTATDIYSLGVVLYELLSGEKPLDMDVGGFEKILETISTAEPIPPSEVVDSDTLPFSHRELRGDIDNIVLKAVRKEPERRYRSVEDLADDVLAHLEARPIEARPNTFRYRAGKLILRNKAAFAAGAIITAALIAATTVSLWQARAARRESETAQAMNRFLQNMLLTAVPGTDGPAKKGAQASIVDVLTEAQAQLDGPDLAAQPEVRAELRHVIGSGFLAQGLYDQAGRDLRQTVREQAELYGSDSPKLMDAELDLAALYLATADYEQADAIYERYYPEMRSSFERGERDSGKFASALSDFAVAKRARGDSARAETLWREALDLAQKFGLDSRRAWMQTMLTLLLVDEGRFDEAKAAQAETVARIRVANIADDPTLPSALTLMGSIRMESGDNDEARSDLLEAETLYRKLFGPDSLPIYDNLRLQAQVSYQKGEYGVALDQIDSVIAAYDKNANPKYISYATALTTKGLILNKLTRRDEAEAILRNALRLRQENLPADHFMTALTKGALGEVLLGEQKTQEAAPLLNESLDSLLRSQKQQNPRLDTARRRVDLLR